MPTCVYISIDRNEKLKSFALGERVRSAPLYSAVLKCNSNDLGGLASENTF